LRYAQAAKQSFSRNRMSKRLRLPKKVVKRRYVFKFKAPRLGHYTAVFTIRCVDDRFRRTFNKFIEHLHIDHIDPKSPAGGAKVFASPDRKSAREHYLQEIKKSIALHQVRRILLFTHSDCQAYGGLGRFRRNAEEEFNFHVRELQKAKKVVKKKFPRLKVETYFINWKGVART